MSKQKRGWVSRLAAVMKTAKAELELADVSGLAVVFPELEADEKPAVDNKVTVDGDAMFTGTVETDEYIFTIEEGVVTEMIDLTEINEDEVIEELLDVIEAKDEEIQTLTASLEKTKKLYAALGKDPKQVRNGKTDTGVENRAAAAINRIKNRKNK